MKRNTMTRRTVVQTNQNLSFVKFAACMVLVLGLGASAWASCGDSMVAMAAAASARSQSGTQTALMHAGAAPGSDSRVNPSVVGLWHIRFVVGDQTIQEAYQAWNVGGTEIHNPNVDPRTGNVCLGAWKKVAPLSYKLAHRVWTYDTNGGFQGTIHLSETITLSNDGKSHTGSFALDFYDPSGNFEFEVTGNVAAERISVE
jgi:hypothetical protein